MKLELIVIVFDFLMTETISLEIEFDLAVLLAKRETRIRFLGRPYSNEDLNALL